MTIGYTQDDPTMISSNLINQPAYLNFLDTLQHRLGQPMGKTPLEQGLTDFYDHCLALAGLDAGTLLVLIQQQPQATLNYICTKLDAFSEPEGGEDNIVDEPLPSTMPLGHLIEFALLGQDGGIANYLEQLRVPKARQYQKQIGELFAGCLA